MNEGGNGFYKCNHRSAKSNERLLYAQELYKFTNI